jgi:hypothetical protein
MNEDEIRQDAYYRWVNAGRPENAGTRFWDEAVEAHRRRASRFSWLSMPLILSTAGPPPNPFPNCLHEVPTNLFHTDANLGTYHLRAYMSNMLNEILSEGIMTRLFSPRPAADHINLTFSVAGPETITDEPVVPFQEVAPEVDEYIGDDFVADFIDEIGSAMSDPDRP